MPRHAWADHRRALGARRSLTRRGMLDGVDRVVLGSGWDSDAVLVDGTWVERTAKHPGAEPWLRAETRLLPWLAPRVPLPVPQPEVVGEAPLVVRHRLLPGSALHAPTAGHGAALGRFLRALHDVPVDEADACGVPDAAAATRLRVVAFRRFDQEVVPRLPVARHEPVRALLARLADVRPIVLVHGDLRDEHVLTDGEADTAGNGTTLTGVIDWSAARIADRAKDLAWPVAHGEAFGDAVLAAYGATTEEVARARDWHAVGPCYAVVHGLDTADDHLVDEALAAL